MSHGPMSSCLANASASEENSSLIPPHLTIIINTVFIKTKLQKAVPILVEVKRDQLPIILWKAVLRRSLFPIRIAELVLCIVLLSFYQVPNTVLIFLPHVLKHPFSCNFFILDRKNTFLLQIFRCPFLKKTSVCPACFKYWSFS